MRNPRWLVLCLLALPIGCAGGRTRNIEGPARGPGWVQRGSGSFRERTGTVVYGVGAANAMLNIAVQRKASDNLACERAAATMQALIASLMKDFIKTHADYFRRDTAAAGELVDYVSKSVAEPARADCRIAERWEDENTGALYALARMDADSAIYGQYEDNVKKAIQGEHRSVVGERAEEALKNLHAEIEKQRKLEKKIFGK